MGNTGNPYNLDPGTGHGDRLEHERNARAADPTPAEAHKNRKGDIDSPVRGGPGTRPRTGILKRPFARGQKIKKRLTRHQKIKKTSAGDPEIKKRLPGDPKIKKGSTRYPSENSLEGKPEKGKVESSRGPGPAKIRCGMLRKNDDIYASTEYGMLGAKREIYASPENPMLGEKDDDECSRGIGPGPDTPAQGPGPRRNLEHRDRR